MTTGLWKAAGPIITTRWNPSSPVTAKDDFTAGGARVVPPATVRYGSYVAPNVVLMPSYVNIGAYVDFGHHGGYLGHGGFLRPGR